MVIQLPPSNSAFLEKVRLLDLSPLAYQLRYSASGPRWTQAKIIKAVARYLAFLFLIDRYPHLQLVPSQEVDIVWHYHILDTRKYAEDCQLLFGQFIHHFPYFGTRGEADRLNLKQAYILTQVLYRKHFGDDLAIDQALPADCEPLRMEPTLEAGCAYLQTSQQRPGVAIAIDDVLHFFSVI